MITSYVWPPPSRCLIVVSAGRSKRWISTPTQPSNSISWPLELLAHPSLSINKRRLLKPLSPHQQISQRNDSVMTYHSIVECVTNRPFGHDPAFNVVNNVVQINRVHYLFSYVVHAFERSCVRTHERSNAWTYARGRVGAPLPARGAMALAPPPKIPSAPSKTRYDKLTTMMVECLGSFETRYDKLTTIMVECPERER